VRFAFGSAREKPAELLEQVRALVEAGLPAEVAEAGLTSTAAEFLGVEDRLGRVAPGFDATFTLWRGDPLLDKEANPAWIFVDGFASEFPLEKKSGDGPAEGVDASGTWTLEFVVEGEGQRIEAATLILEMEKDGKLIGTLELENPLDQTRLESEIEGQVTGDELELECTFGESEIEAKLSGKLDGDSLEGKGTFQGPWSPEPKQQSFRGTRSPK
jgi:hypothetical protein